MVLIRNLVVLFSLVILAQSQYYLEDKSECVFPFKYNGKWYNDCIMDERKYSWCSLTETYQGVWKYCWDMTKSNLVCTGSCGLSLFSFNGITYKSCKTSSTTRKYCLEYFLNNDPCKDLTNYCGPEFSSISPWHTACLPKHMNLVKSGLNPEDKQIIVDLHNKWRSIVNVSAAAMQKMYWDDTLSLIAQRHADRCSFTHDDPNLRQVPGIGRATGQNIVMITNSMKYNWTRALDTMYAGELKRWVYGSGVKPEFAQYGKYAYHYTQIIVEQVSKVGCGYSECVFSDRLEVFFVCNYNYLQTYSESIRPYRQGASCEKCLNNCVKNLCDCNGKECFGGKTLDVSTCQCV